MTESEAIAALEALGWEWDEDDGTLHPPCPGYLQSPEERAKNFEMLRAFSVEINRQFVAENKFRSYAKKD